MSQKAKRRCIHKAEHPGAETGGAETGGAETGGAETGGSEPGGAETGGVAYKRRNPQNGGASTRR